MAELFRFALSDEEKAALKDLVRLSILQDLMPERKVKLPPAPTARLREQYGAFVTLKIGGRLRGCIGYIQGQGPVWDTVSRMAKAAAFEDSRFPALSLGEFERLDIEISILSPVSECPDPSAIEVGRHGLIVRKGGRSGLLLPQVATEWKWDRETFLAHTCLKAGLPETAWKTAGCSLLWFEAEVF
ncbi:MAG: AmmeMemoRadiSam system protein A [Thermodesulfobacteriota bacterium]